MTTDSPTDPSDHDASSGSERAGKTASREPPPPADSHDTPAETDGGTVERRTEPVDYLDEEINLFRPATPFMRDNLKMIFSLFAVWLVFIFGPVTLSYFFPEFMTETRILGGYPLNFFLTALIAPAAALTLAAAYAWYRDRLDDKYGIVHGTDERTAPPPPPAAETDPTRTGETDDHRAGATDDQRAGRADDQTTRGTDDPTTGGTDDHAASDRDDHAASDRDDPGTGGERT